MNKLITLVISGLLLISVAGCNTAKTNVESPDNTNKVGQSPTTDTARQNQSDATSEVRRRQVDSDIRAREQRNNATGGDADRADGDLKSEVRSKLEANIPASQLAVDAKNGAVTVSGTVPTQQQLAKVEPLTKQIKGVKKVTVNVKVAPAKPKSGKS